MIFVSNYYNHHQSALCGAFRKQDSEYYFVQTGEMRQERRNLGYGMDDIPDYVLSAHKDEAQKELCRKRILEADTAIVGSAPEALVQPRIQAGKLTFRYTERLLKKPMPRTKYLTRRLLMHWRNPSRKMVYLLCAGGYVAADYGRFGLFHNRTYKWGYFPETKVYEDPDGLFQDKKPACILWAGRLIDWKHPEYALQIASHLKSEGIPFELNMVGTGELEPWVQSRIESLGLERCVHLLGAMKPEQVRQHMETAGIFLATSDRQEGWGAVVNEAMNSGCAVVASHAMGSVPYLIENEENGLVFQSENIDMLYEKVKSLLERPDRQQELGRQAYETITTLWNAEVASQRLIALSERILAGEKYPNLFESGPCSRAEILHDDWM